MPRYFFHVRDCSDIKDDHGFELPDDDTARRHGAMMLGKILHDEPRALWASGRIRLTATTDRGAVLFTLEVTSG